MKAFADNKFSEGKMMISVFNRTENILGYEENADYRHFLLFPQCFQTDASYSGSLKVVIVWQRDNYELLKFILSNKLKCSLHTQKVYKEQRVSAEKH